MAVILSPATMTTPTVGHDAARVPAAVDRGRWQALAVTLAVFCVGALVAAARRGPWVDEFWTLWQSRHDIGLADVFEQRWAADFHPPLFSFLHWLAMPAMGEAIEVHRLLNLLPLAWAVAFVVLCVRRYPRSSDVLWSHALLLLSFPVSLRYFAEMRSYFWQIAVIFVLLGTAVVTADRGRDLDPATDRALVGFFVPTLAVGINLHYFSSLLCGMLAVAMALLCWRNGQRRWARTIVGATIASLLPLLAFLQAQSAFLSAESTHYWVTGGAREALHRLAEAARGAVAANAVAGIAASAVALAWLEPRLLRGRLRVFDAGFVAATAPAGPRRQLMGALLTVAVGYAVALLIVHARTPIVYARYLIAMQAFLLAIVALLSAGVLAASRRWAQFAVLAALAGALSTAWHTMNEGRWNVTAQAAAEARQACPGSVVRSIVADREKGSRNSRTVLQWAYRQQAQRFGFEPEPAFPGTAVEPAAGCPAVLWAEHLDPAEVRLAATAPATALRNLGITLSGADAERATATPGSSGIVLVVPPSAP